MEFRLQPTKNWREVRGVVADAFAPFAVLPKILSTEKSTSEKRHQFGVNKNIMFSCNQTNKPLTFWIKVLELFVAHPFQRCFRSVGHWAGGGQPFRIWWYDWHLPIVLDQIMYLIFWKNICQFKGNSCETSTFRDEKLGPNLMRSRGYFFVTQQHGHGRVTCINRSSRNPFGNGWSLGSDEV